MPDDRRPTRGLRIDPSDLLLEIISIVIAIVLATAVGQAVDAHRASVRTHEALAQICQEIGHDDSEMAAHHALHSRLRDAFSTTLLQAQGDRLDADAFDDAFSKNAPTGFHPFVATVTAFKHRATRATRNDADGTPAKLLLHRSSDTIDPERHRGVGRPAG